MVGRQDASTHYGLQLNVITKCGPVSVYIRPEISDIVKINTLPIIKRKPASVLQLPTVCEDQSVTISQTSEIKYENLTVDGTAGLTMIVAKRTGIADMVEKFDAYEFNPDPNAKYQLSGTTDEDGNSTVTQTWTISDVRKNNYVGLYQFYFTLDTPEPIQHPAIYMMSIPFVVKPKHYEATSVGVHTCYPFRNSIRKPGEQPPIKHLGTVHGYRPCFRVLVQSSEPVTLRLSPYHESELNPQPAYSAPSVGGMTEHWYVLDDDRVPHRRNQYLLAVSTEDYTFMVPFYLTKYTPARPVMSVQKHRDTVRYPNADTGFPFYLAAQNSSFLI